MRTSLFRTAFAIWSFRLLKVVIVLCREGPVDATSPALLLV
jgi:hypothetical protein